MFCVYFIFLCFVLNFIFRERTVSRERRLRRNDKRKEDAKKQQIVSFIKDLPFKPISTAKTHLDL